MVDSDEALVEQNFERQIKELGYPLLSEEDVKKICVVGEGGFGKVYKGTYKGDTVAIKKIKLDRKDQEVFDSLFNEIKVMVKATDPNIPKFLGMMKRKNHYHLIFEFIEGKTLKDLYNTMDDKEKMLALLNLSGILASFHEKKLIHRDIKPGNVMIEPSKKVRLIDFGVSKIATHTATYTKAQIGTIPYMSPEQFQIDLDRFNDPNADDVKPVPISTKSDVWSLGVMISEIFSKVRPYFNITKKQNPPTELMITKRLMTNTPFPVPKDIEQDIKEVVDRATQVDPEQRASAQEIKEMLEKVMTKRYHTENNPNPNPNETLNNNNNNQEQTHNEDNKEDQKENSIKDCSKESTKEDPKEKEISTEKPKKKKKAKKGDKSKGSKTKHLHPNPNLVEENDKEDP